MKKWMEKLIDQLEFDWNKNSRPGSSSPSEQHSNGESFPPPTLTEEKATLLFLIDAFHKHLIEIDQHSIRKTREQLDEFSKQILNFDGEDLEATLFRFRQFISGYKIDEYTYIQKTFDDFKKIIWDFVDQLSEDLAGEELQDSAVQKNFTQLREAVDANSIDLLRTNARQFIDSYIELHSKNSERKKKKMHNVQRSLESVRKKLVEANHNMNVDHLTQSFNRKSFDEQIHQVLSLSKASRQNACLLMLDIDHFKKINDQYGHAMGDFVLVQLVVMLKEIFHESSDFVARTGGEEFAIILPGHDLDRALARAEKTLKKVSSEVFVKDTMKLKFTVSIGIAKLEQNENVDQWMQRADQALYNSKNSGRNCYSVAPSATIGRVA